MTASVEHKMEIASAITSSEEINQIYYTRVRDDDGNFVFVGGTGNHVPLQEPRQIKEKHKRKKTNLVVSDFLAQEGEKATRRNTKPVYMVSLSFIRLHL